MMLSYLKNQKQAEQRQQQILQQLQSQQQKCHRQLLLSIALATIVISSAIIFS